MVDPIARLGAALGGRYRIEREIGHGGMATVYLAEDVKHHRRVALKVLRPELAAAIGPERFLREIEVTAGLQHPHILPLYDSGEADGLLFYVMPFVAGETLRDRLSREGRLTVAEALRIGRDVAAALTAAHAQGIVHRDIKPENILLADGEALVADFGIALAVSRIEVGRLTESGVSIGTVAYMSPEQIAGEAAIDARSDVYSLGCVLFEMLAGGPPFSGATAQVVIGQALSSPPPRLRSRRDDVPPKLDAAVARSLAKLPAERFATAREFLEACIPPSQSPPRRRAVLVALGVAALVVAAVAIPLWKSVQANRARLDLPRIRDLANRGRYLDAYQLAVAAERRIPDDTALSQLVGAVADLLTVTTTPAGASAYLQRLPEANESVGDSTLIGTTPIVDRRIARADYRVSLVLAGHQTVERIVSSALGRNQVAGDRGRRVVLDVSLPAVDSVPAGMVAVPGGRYGIVSPDLPLGLSTDLADYFLDRFEVSNEQFAEFVRAGGYANASWWPAGSPKTFADRTGLPAPRDWVSKEPPAGEGRHPVVGVSWYEAAAFCRSRGKRLPTLYEWEKAARNGIASVVGVVMPWGYVSAAISADRRANFGGTGTVPVDAYPFGISPFGAYAMAGNVKEWLANPVGDGFAVAGGSWQDPAYVFSEVGSLPGETAAPSVGFRCARTAGTPAADQGGGPVSIQATPPAYRPVDAATFQTLLSHYRYDRRPANPRGGETVETADWRRERLWIDGVGGDSVLIYLYLPRRFSPPFQTLVYVASSGAFFYEPVWRAAEQDVGPFIKGGRAAIAVVLKGMIERPNPPGSKPPPPPSVEFRDLMVLHATELRLGMDYLATRPEFDSTRLAYVGVSFGAGSRLPFAAVDDRFRAVILIGAGIDERIQPTLPEAANYNFAPYIRSPKLMLNGRQDEEHPWNTRARPLWNLLREPKELVLLEGVGHHPPVEQRVLPITAFLDRTLGPVRR
jgi:tRNA A-37 threonylcarbamoyl transferase component Bud32